MGLHEGAEGKTGQRDWQFAEARARLRRYRHHVVGFAVAVVVFAF